MWSHIIWMWQDHVRERYLSQATWTALISSSLICILVSHVPFTVWLSVYALHPMRDASRVGGRKGTPAHTCSSFVHHWERIWLSVGLLPWYSCRPCLVSRQTEARPADSECGVWQMALCTCMQPCGLEGKGRPWLWCKVWGLLGLSSYS